MTVSCPFCRFWSCGVAYLPVKYCEIFSYRLVIVSKSVVHNTEVYFVWRSFVFHQRVDCCNKTCHFPKENIGLKYIYLDRFWKCIHNTLREREREETERQREIGFWHPRLQLFIFSSGMTHMVELHNLGPNLMTNRAIFPELDVHGHYTFNTLCNGNINHQRLKQKIGSGSMPKCLPLLAKKDL